MTTFGQVLRFSYTDNRPAKDFLIWPQDGTTSHGGFGGPRRTGLIVHRRARGLGGARISDTQPHEFLRTITEGVAFIDLAEDVAITVVNATARSAAGNPGSQFTKTVQLAGVSGVTIV